MSLYSQTRKPVYLSPSRLELLHQRSALANSQSRRIAWSSRWRIRFEHPPPTALKLQTRSNRVVLQSAFSRSFALLRTSFAPIETGDSSPGVRGESETRLARPLRSPHHQT